MSVLSPGFSHKQQEPGEVKTDVDAMDICHLSAVVGM